MFNFFVKKGILLMSLSLTQVACSVVGIRSAETPEYEVLLKENNKEIRAYSSYVIAKTLMKDDSDQSRSEAFRVIAGYIFGGNEKKQSISMTAPVVQKSAVSSEKISMTVPVSQKQGAKGLEMTFMMPSKYKMSDLPKPNDVRVTFQEIPAQTIGAIRYSGLGSTKTNSQKTAELRKWILLQSKYKINSEAIRAGYDPPWTLPFLRRLEMMFELSEMQK